MWSIIPITDRCSSFRALVFRVLSRIGASVEEVQASQHRGYPFRLFLLLKNPELWGVLSTECLDMMDEWSRQFVLEYRDSVIGVASEEMLQRLAFRARVQETDIAAIEALHATCRRLLIGRSVQTHKMSFLDLNAEWVNGRFRSNVFCSAKKRRSFKRTTKACPW